MKVRTNIMVVGTTPDYINLIRKVCPNQTIFLIDPALRQNASEPKPNLSEEILCYFDNYEKSMKAVENFIFENNITLKGITCFDCESMELAAFIAENLNLPYPSIKSIRNCRDQFASKKLWKQNDILCPDMSLMRSAEEIYDFIRDINGPCVIKPLHSSGSELDFKCSEFAWETTRNELGNQRDSRLYNLSLKNKILILAEKMIDGVEFSCDFIIKNNHLDIIRLTSKIPYHDGLFGTILGYQMCSGLTDGVDLNDFKNTLYKSAKTIGISRAVCMVDFIISENQIFYWK